jgi:hypothetical protein
MIGIAGFRGSLRSVSRKLLTRLRVSSTALLAGCAALLSFAGAAAIARVVHAPAHASHPVPVATVAKASSRGPRGPRGARGARGPRGITGGKGPTGAAGVPQVLEQNLTVNWEGSFADSSGRDTATFVAPGIGTGEVTCNQNTQWVHFQPYNQNTDVAMWTAKFQTNDATVRTARHTTYTGQTFYEGLNHYAGEQQSTGEIIGIITTQGKLGGSNGAGQDPTTFRLSWDWNFTDSSNPYCFMAGTVDSNGG